MAEELIDSYVDRAGVKGDTDFMVASLREVYSEFKKLESVKVDLKGASGLGQTLPAMNQAKTGMDSLAEATKTVEQRIAAMNGKSKEFTDTLLKQAKAQKELAAAAVNEAKAANETAKAKQNEAKAVEQAAKAKEKDKKLAEQAANDYLQLSRAYNEAAARAKNLAIANNDLDFKTPEVRAAVKQANDLGNVLKKLDASVGQFQRNVGNYSSSAKAIADAIETAKTSAQNLASTLAPASPEAGKLRGEFEALNRITKDPEFLNISNNTAKSSQQIDFLNRSLEQLKRSGASSSQIYADLRNQLNALSAEAAQQKAKFDGLGFSFTQVARELPSLAVSVQTFALAISNNLPMVADELAKARKEIAALKAEGKDAPTLGQKLKQAFLSPQLGLSLLITGITLFIGKLFGAGNAAEKNAEKLKKFNDELKNMSVFTDRAKNDLSDLKTIIDQGFTRKSNEIKLTGDPAADLKILDEQLRRQKEYVTEFKKRLVVADQEFDKVSKNEKRITGTKEEREKLEEKLNQQIETRNSLLKESLQEEGRISEIEQEILLKRKELAQAAADKAKEEAQAAKEAADFQLQLEYELQAIKLQQTIDFNNEAAAEDGRQLYDRLSALRVAKEAEIELIILKAETEKKIGTKTAKEIELIEQQKLDGILRAEREFSKKRQEIKSEEAEQFAAEEERVREALQKGIEAAYNRFQKAEEERTRKQKEESDKRKKIEEDEAEAKKQLQKQLAEELQTLTFTILTSSIERQKNEIQNQIDLIEKRKQADIEAANQTFTNQQEKAAAIAVIEARAQTQRETLQRRQRDLDIKKAQFEKAAAVARIIQETAMNVVKYIANPFLSALAAAVGAAQLATVIAQPIPRYKHGKNINDLYEGPAVVGDGGRKEAIIREDGGVEITPDTPTLTYVKKRDIVLPDASMLSDLVVSGKMGGKLVERTAVIENGNVEEAIKRLEGSVVGAIKKIPRPVISVSNVISQRVFHGDSSNQYLNNNLQGLK